MFQPNPITTDSGIVPHKTSAHKRYLLDNIASGRLDASNGISKVTATKQYGSWDRCYTFLKNSGITDEFLGGIPKEQRKILVSSFTASVQRNQFGTTKKNILLYGTVKSTISDVSVSFRTHLQSDPTLESSGQTSLLLQRKIRGYKTLDPTTKHQKAIPGKIVLHVYRKTNTHLETSIVQLIAGAFFFGMRSCEYSTNIKG